YIVHNSGKMLIASNRVTVGVMNSHAMARSDMPPSRDVVEGFAGVIAMEVVSVKSARALTIDSFALDAPAQRGRAYRRVPMAPDLVVEHAQRQRGTGHLERRGDIADQGTRDTQSSALEPLPCRVEQQVELAQRRAAE